MIRGSGCPGSWTMATLVATRFPVSSMPSSMRSPRAKHAASVVSPPSAKTSKSCFSRSRQPRPSAAQGDEVGGAVEAVAHQHDPAAGRKPSRHPRDQFPLLGEADGAPGLPDPPRQGQGPSTHPHAQHQHLVPGRDLALVQEQHRRAARGGVPDRLLGEGPHDRVAVQPGIGQQARDPLVAHVHALRRPRHRRRQVHEVGAALAEHCRHQEGQLAALRLALPRQPPRQLRLDPRRQPYDPAHAHAHPVVTGRVQHARSPASTKLMDGKAVSPRAEAPGVGNKAIALKNCRNVILRDFAILAGGHFGILATGVDNLTIDNLRIDTNRDGMDIDCCRNVRVSNCSVNSPWDDGICPKSSFALGYARATENVTITNCYVTGDYRLGTLLDGTFQRFGPEFDRDVWNRTGRIKCGTESNGGFKGITISNCVFEGCRGFALETVDGAALEDITFTGVTMRDIRNAPFFLRLGARMRGPTGVPVGTLRRVIISDVVCHGPANDMPAI